MLDKTSQQVLAAASTTQSWPAMNQGSLMATEPKIFHAVLGVVARSIGLEELRIRRKDVTYADFEGSPKAVLDHKFVGVTLSSIRGFGSDILSERHYLVSYRITDEGGVLLSEATLYCAAK